MGENEVHLLLAGIAGGFVCRILVAMLVALVTPAYYRRRGPEDLDKFVVAGYQKPFSSPPIAARKILRSPLVYLPSAISLGNPNCSGKSV